MHVELTEKEWRTICFLLWQEKEVAYLGEGNYSANSLHEIQKKIDNQTGLKTCSCSSCK